MFNFLFKSISGIFKNSKKCFMEKEIREQPDIIEKLIRKYIKLNYNISLELPDNISNIVFIASGSSYHSAAIVTEFINKYIPFFASAYYSSEIQINNDICVKDNVLYIFISQSGETKDTNNVLNQISKKTSYTYAVTNTKNSSIYNNCVYKLLINAGSERAIASTKAMSAQTFTLFLIAAKFMEKKGINTEKIVQNLIDVPFAAKEALNTFERQDIFSKVLPQSDSIVILGNNINYQLAKEGALKIQETSYISTFACPFGEFLHGHMAVLNKKSSVIAIVNRSNYELANMVINKLNSLYNYDKFFIMDSDYENFSENQSVIIPTDNDICFLFSALVVLQIAALNISKSLNRDIDKPDGLTKVVG